MKISLELLEGGELRLGAGELEKREKEERGRNAESSGAEPKQGKLGAASGQPVCELSAVAPCRDPAMPPTSNG